MNRLDESKETESDSLVEATSRYMNTESFKNYLGYSDKATGDTKFKVGDWIQDVHHHNVHQIHKIAGTTLYTIEYRKNGRIKDSNSNVHVTKATKIEKPSHIKEEAPGSKKAADLLAHLELYFDMLLDGVIEGRWNTKPKYKALFDASQKLGRLKYPHLNMLRLIKKNFGDDAAKAVKSNTKKISGVEGKPLLRAIKQLQQDILGENFQSLQD